MSKHIFFKRTCLSILLCASYGAYADCSSSPCSNPSLSQSEVLFGKITQLYPQVFSSPASMQTTVLTNNIANYRMYGNSTGLATYMGGLWYTLDGNWIRFSSLDEGNQLFCNNACWSSSSSTNTNALIYPIVDTAQIKCYDASTEITCPISNATLYGQDAQQTGNQPNYTLSSDGKTVLDNVTKLTWMRGPNTTLTTPVASDKKTYTAAQEWVNTVNSMSYGGFNDWRLPSIKELYSLIKFNGLDVGSYNGTDTSSVTPFIDKTYFNFGYGQTSAGERLIDSQYASSNVYVSTLADTGIPLLFGVNFADGRIKGYGVQMPIDGTYKTFFVQLVRGSSNYGVNSFTDNGNQTVTDATTGLTWSKSDSGTAMTWQEALAWVQTQNAANYLGHNDWRLPNTKELQSVVNYANSPDYNGKPAIDMSFFNTTAIINENGDSDYPYFWTSTSHMGYSGMVSAVYISFGRALGYTTLLNKWVDIHGAGCQRTDPKAGPPFSWADTYTVTKNGITYTGYSFGPQGDALRGKNFVRLVR